jgi:hypothetical protein
MKHRGSILAFALALLGILAPSDAICAPKPVLVHYMPWYVAKPYSGSWGWHWTMNHFNPDLTNASGQRQIASWFYPAIGPYDSADPVVLEYHVLLMKLAGIDGVIVDWYGMDEFLDYGVNNRRTAALFQWTRRAGLQFSICYEDRTIQVEIDRGFIAASNAVSHAQQTMLYLQSNYFGDPSYFRRGTQPLLLNFGPQYFKSSGQWQTIFSVLAASNQPAFFTLDNRASGALGAFNWPPMWLSQNTGGTLTVSSLNSYLEQFQQKATLWPASISSAFPRFVDIYAQANVGPSYGTLPDNNGDNLRATFGRALTNSSSVVQLVTWNDFGEGTIIEPTSQYGYRDLGIVQDLRRNHLDPAFSYHTNHLHLATRIYNARRLHATNSFVMAELDRAFTNIVAGRVGEADTQLRGIESRQPVIYSLSSASNALQFNIGGFLSQSATLVQTTSNLARPDWLTATSIPPSTNLLQFQTPTSNLGPNSFIRLQPATP